MLIFNGDFGSMCQILFEIYVGDNRKMGRKLE